MGAEIMDILHHLNKDEGRTIVMVTHNEEQAADLSHVRFHSMAVRYNNLNYE